MNPATQQIVRVKLFAAAKQLAGAQEWPVTVTAGTNIGQLRTALVAAVPALSAIVARARFAVDCQFATDATIVSEGAEVALIPPVSGG